MMAITADGAISTAPMPIATTVDTTAVISGSTNSGAGDRRTVSLMVGRAAVSCVICSLVEQFGMNGAGKPLQGVDIARRRRALGIGHEQDMSILDRGDVFERRAGRQVFDDLVVR